MQGGHGVGRPPLGHVEHHLLGLVDGGFDVFGHRVAEIGDLAGHADEAAQERVLLHDGGVVPRVGDGRGVGLQRNEHRRVAHGLEETGALQLVGDGHRVDRLAPLDEGTDGAEDVPVRRLVEVPGRTASRRLPRRHRWRAASRRGATPPLRGCAGGPDSRHCSEGRVPHAAAGGGCLQRLGPRSPNSARSELWGTRATSWGLDPPNPRCGCGQPGITCGGARAFVRTPPWSYKGVTPARIPGAPPLKKRP